MMFKVIGRTLRKDAPTWICNVPAASAAEALKKAVALRGWYFVYRVEGPDGSSLDLDRAEYERSGDNDRA